MLRLALLAAIFCALPAPAAFSQPALPLRTLAEIPLTGSASRLDYESLDPRKGIVYVAHMGSDSVVAVDVNRRRVAATISGTATVRGVLAVPDLGRVYAAAEGTGEIAVIDARTERVIARVAAGNVDGLAYDPATRRLFVSDESGGKDVVIDTRTNKVVARIDLGGEAGNTVYDRGSGHIFVAVQTRNIVAEIDPASERVVRSYPVPGCLHGHGLIVDSAQRVAYVACQANARLIRLDLRTGSGIGERIGTDPDVLALDENLHRLYAASESGIVSIFDVTDGRFEKIAQGFYAPNAHVVGVDQRTHRLFFPLPDVNGHPVLRIAAPVGISDKT